MPRQSSKSARPSSAPRGRHLSRDGRGATAGARTTRGRTAPAAGRRSQGPAKLTGDQLLAIQRSMLLAREYEDTILRLYHQGKVVGGAYSGNGNEATAAASAFALGDGDALFPLHRDLAAHFVRGQKADRLMRQFLGRVGGMTEGRDGTGHYTDAALRIYGNISHLGAMIPVACGMALAFVMRKQKNVVMTYIGDGGANVGEVHEALAMASVMRLPLVLLIENNQYAYSTPIAKQFLVDKLSRRADGYGIPGATVDGTDVEAVYAACRTAVDRARAMQGPSIVESVTMRMHGHAAHDNAWYVPKTMLQTWKKRDPVEKIGRLLASRGIQKPGALKELRKEIAAEISAAAEAALALPYPPGEDALRGVWADEGEVASR